MKVTIGRRLPLVYRGHPDTPEAQRRYEIDEWPSQPGDYVGPVYGYTGDVPAVFFLKPNARDPAAPRIARVIQHVVSPPHTFRECADGSLEIRASIGDMHSIGSIGDMHGTDRVSDGWHGHLNEGHRWEIDG